MVRRVKVTIASVLSVAIATLAVVLISSCRKPRQAPIQQISVERAGEPEQYSATVVRTTYEGASNETHVTREARSGEQRREEWTERDLKRALIWRPDLGKSFLLDLDRREYVEMDITARQIGASGARAATDIVLSSQNASDANLGESIPAIDHYFDDLQSPALVETTVLPPVVVDGHSCKVYEQRTTFVDGHIEITRRFRADDLEGLPLRIDCESGDGVVRVTTERRDVSLVVTADSFVVPADFKRIDKLR